MILSLSSLNSPTFRSLLVLVASLVLSACAKDPSQEVPQAKLTNVASQEAKTQPSSSDSTSTSKADSASNTETTSSPKSSAALPLGGEIVFIGSKVTGSHTNRFKTWSGSVTLGQNQSLDGAQFNFEVDTASVEADYLDPKPWSGKLRKHFLSADFFDVQNHPKATFVSSSLKKLKDQKYSVKGILTIRGQSKEITFPATITQNGGFEASTEFSINRKEYNIMYNGKADDLIREGVVLKITLKAKS